MAKLDLSNLVVGETFVQKSVYIVDCAVRFSKANKPFVAGTIRDGGLTSNLKVWDADVVTFFQTHTLAGHSVKCSGRIDSYQGTIDVTLTGCFEVDPVEDPPLSFYKSCDVPAVWNEFLATLQGTMSTKGMEVLQRVLTAADLGRFQQEFAGAKMHDAQIGGLLNHTTKMCKIAKVVLENEPRFATIPDSEDLLMLGVALHDVGKVKEMEFGVYQPNSFVTHRTLGIELLHSHKDFIVQTYSDKFYYMLLSVLQGHHGEFGDAPTSVFAYFVHLIDMVDSQVTGVFDRIESGGANTTGPDATVFCNGSNLVY